MKPTEDNRRVTLPSGKHGYWTGETGPDGDRYEIKTLEQEVGGLGRLYYPFELEPRD